MKQRYFYLGIAVLLFLITTAMPVKAQEADNTGNAMPMPFSNGAILLIATVAGVIGVGAFHFQPFVAYGSTEYLIAGLTLITAIAHLLVGVTNDIIFLNGLGYLVLLLALYVIPAELILRLRKQLRWLLMGYAALTIVLYFVIHPWGYLDGSLDWLGLFVKVVEMGLIRVIFFGTHREVEMET